MQIDSHLSVTSARERIGRVASDRAMVIAHRLRIAVPLDLGSGAPSIFSAQIPPALSITSKDGLSSGEMPKCAPALLLKFSLLPFSKEGEWTKSKQA